MTDIKIIFENNIEEFVPNNSFDTDTLMYIPKIKKIFELNKQEKIINLDNISRTAFINIIALVKIQNSENDDKYKQEIINNLVNNLDIDNLFDFIIATKYLELDNFIDIAGHRFKNVLYNNSPEKIREIFKLENDLHVLSFNL